MRRYKIGVSPENKEAGIFSNIPVLWAVFDTQTNRTIGSPMEKDAAVAMAISEEKK